MFGWVPAEIWIFIGLGISIAFIIEIIKILLYKNRSKKYILRKLQEQVAHFS